MNVKMNEIMSFLYIDERILNKVQRVLRPNLSEPKLINRRLGKAKRGSVAKDKSDCTKANSQTSLMFQKKVIVLKYIRSRAPLQFNVNDGLVLTTGFFL